MTSALVSGARGFVGSALVRALAGRGVKVLALTRQAGNPFADLAPAVQVVTVPDYRVPTLEKGLDGRTAQLVFNVAAAGVDPAQRGADRLIEGNVGVVAGLLTVTAEWGLRRFVHTGSCAQYGAVPEGSRLSESGPCAPNSVYGAAKAAAETFADGYARALGVPFASLRPFMVYGTGEAARRLLPQLIEGLRRGQTVELSPGQQVRDFLHVSDLLDAYLALGEAASLPHRVYNAATGVATTVKEVGETVATLMGQPHNLLRWGARDYRPDDVPWLVGDASRLTQDTGWTPRVTLTEGLRRMIAGRGESSDMGGGHA